MDIFFKFVDHYSVVVIAYFIMLNSVYGLLLLLSIPQVFRRTREIALEERDIMDLSSPYAPVSIVAPAYNEEATITESIKHMLALSYSEYEVIVVNDGSKDDTVAVMIEFFDLYKVPPAFQVKLKSKEIRGYYRSREYPNLLLIDKENGGKADALNAGISAARYSLFLAIDADTLIAKDALYRSMSPMILDKDVVAVGGTIGVINDCEFDEGRVSVVNMPSQFIAGIQVVEYIRAYLFGRVGWNWLGGNMVISGAFGLFMKDAVIECGGYLTGTVGEDLELVLKLHHRGKKKGRAHKVVSIPDTVCWTEVPSTKKVLAKQRERWHRGLIDCLIKHREMFFNPKYGAIGMLSFPFFVFGELLAPVIEITGWITFFIGLCLGIIDFDYLLQFVYASVGLSMILTFSSIVLAQVSLGRYHSNLDFMKMILYTVMENFGYRQMTVIWRLEAFYKYAVGDESWGQMTRVGFSKKKK